VEICYQYNTNQVLSVIVDAFGKQAKATLERNAGLSDLELARATSNLSLIKVE
jgi:hypothetical protein